MRTTLVVALVFAAGATAQGPPRGEFWKGTHAFRGVLNKEGYKSVAGWHELVDDPSRGVLIVFGQSNVLNDLCASRDATRFLRNSGAILLATDQLTGRDTRRKFAFRVNGGTVNSPAHCYRSDRGPLPDCPLLIEEPSSTGDRHPIFAGLPEGRLSVIATNLPSFFDAGNQAPLASIAWTQRTSLDFVYGGTIDGNGRYLALADHSVFINEMMLRPDTDNFRFAENVVRWLSDGGRRDRALFYEDGVVQADFNVSLEYADPPVPPQEVLVQVANRFLGNLQREDALNRTLLRLVDHRTLLRTSIFVATLTLLLWGLYRFLHSRQHRERLPRGTAPVTATARADLGRRGDELLAQGNLSEAARELARQTFASFGVTAGPPVVEADGWWNRRAWAKRVGRLWNVAAGSDARVTAGDLTRLTAELRELSSAVAGGALRLDAAAPIR